MQVVVFALAALFVAKGAAMSCYVTEIETRNGFLNKTHKIRNCGEQKGLPISGLGTKRPDSCFKIIGTDPNGHRVDLKGCFTKGECRVIEDAVLNITKLGQSGVYLFPDTKCYECESDICNVAVKFNANFLPFFILLTVYFNVF